MKTAKQRYRDRSVMFVTTMVRSLLRNRDRLLPDDLLDDVPVYLDNMEQLQAAFELGMMPFSEIREADASP